MDAKKDDVVEVYGVKTLLLSQRFDKNGRYIGRCSCGEYVAADVAVGWWEGVQRVDGKVVRPNIAWVTGATSGTWRCFTKGDNKLLLPCPKDGRVIRLTRVVGKVNTTPCDARCTSAKGHQCNCSCNGKNHGSGSLVR